MRLVLCTEPPSVRVDRPRELTRLDAVVEGSGPLSSAVAGLPGVHAVGADLAVEPAALQGLCAVAPADQQWLTSFEAMVGYARAKGWWDGGLEALLVHVVSARPGGGG